MNLLFDTHIFLSVLSGSLAADFPKLFPLAPSNQCIISITSIWEIAIKVRIGKLQVRFPVDRLSQFAIESGLGVLQIEERHVVHTLVPDIDVKDPFDRLLLAQAQAEGMKLVTRDRVLAGHPQAWRP